MRFDSAWLLCAALLARETVANVPREALNGNSPRFLASANTTTALTTSASLSNSQPNTLLNSAPNSSPSSEPGLPSSPSSSPTLVPSTSPTPSSPSSESDDESTRIPQGVPSNPSRESTPSGSTSTGSTSTESTTSGSTPPETTHVETTSVETTSLETSALPTISSGTAVSHNSTGTIQTSTPRTSTSTSTSSGSALISTSGSTDTHSVSPHKTLSESLRFTIIEPPLATEERPTPKKASTSKTSKTPGQDGKVTTKTVTVGRSTSRKPLARPTTTQCRHRLLGEAVIEVSVVHTSTVTIIGDEAYTPPYAAVATPPPFCSGGAAVPSVNLSSYGSIEIGIITFPDTTIYFSTAKPMEPEPTTITLVTTGKNPAVVRSPGPTPGYHVTFPPGGGQADGNHKTAVQDAPKGNHPDPVAPPPPTFEVRAGGNIVVINQHTFTGLESGKTTVVTVDHGTFTINPTAVMGEGATVIKPPPTTPGVAIAKPTVTTLAGVPVTVFGTQAVIGGRTFTIPATGTTMVVGGKTISLGPGTIVVNGQGLTYQPGLPARHTDYVVAGGELLTAKGRSVVVVHSTTYTYGPGLAGATEVVDDDTISIGPSGVRVHGTMVGGESVDADHTAFEVIGGATISKVAPSEVVINGETYKVGPGATLTTAVIGGETVTIGPSGLVVSTLTMAYPFGSYVMTTITPSGTWLDNFPAATKGPGDEENDDEEDGCGLVRPNMRIGVMCLCIAIGVWVLG